MNPKVVGAIAFAGLVIVLAVFAVPPLFDDPAGPVDNGTDPVDNGTEDQPDGDPDEPWDPNVTVEVGPIQGPDDPQDEDDDDPPEPSGGSDPPDVDDDPPEPSGDDPADEEPDSGVTGNSTTRAN